MESGFFFFFFFFKAYVAEFLPLSVYVKEIIATFSVYAFAAFASFFLEIELNL